MTNSMLVRASRAISYALHPLFMPFYTLYLAINADLNIGYLMYPDLRWMIYLMVTIMTILFPILSALLLLRSRMITSLQMPTREERILPFAMTLFYYGLCYFLLRNAPLHDALYAMMTGALVALTLTLFITFRWKISAHMVGIGGLLGAMIGLLIIHQVSFMPLLFLLIVLVGMLGTARLVLHSHSPAQVYAGLVLGLLVVGSSVTFGLSI